MVTRIDILGHIGDFGADKETILNRIKESDGGELELNISSLGGSVDDAFAIYDALKMHKGKKVANLTGFVASAATIIAMGADEVYMSENSLFLVHRCSAGIMAFGGYNADELDNLIAELKATKETNDKVDLIIANIYAKATGKRAKTILDLMIEDKWLNYDEAFDYGFIDGKTKGQKISNEAVMKMVASAKLNNLPKIPNTTDMNIADEIKNLRDFIAEKFKTTTATAEVKILDEKDVADKFKAIEDEMKNQLTAKVTEVETLTAKVTELTEELSKLKAIPTSVGGADPDPSANPKKSDWQNVAEGVLNSLPKI